MGDVLVKPDAADPDLEEEDPAVAHVVKKDAWAEGYIDGSPITALCGTVFVPHRNPEGLPVCELCLQILQSINRAEDN